MHIFFLFFFLPITLAADDHHTSQLLHEYMMANYYHFLGNSSASAAWYSEISTLDSILTYRGYLNFLADAGKFKDIIQLQQKIDTHFAQDKEVQKILIIAYEKTGNSTEAHTRLLRIHQQAKDDPEIAFNLAQMYVQQKEPENALSTIDQFLNSSIRRSHAFIFYFLKAQIYLSLHDHKKALEHVEKCLEFQNQFDKGWLLFAILQEELGNIAKAVEGYTSYLEVTDQPQQQIKQHLLALSLKHKLSAEKVQITAHKKTDFDQVFVLIHKKKYKQALAVLDSLIVKEPHSVDAHLMKIALLYYLHDIPVLMQVLEHSISLDSAQVMWYKITHLLAQQDQWREKAYSILERAYQKHNHIWAALYGADIALRMNEYRTAYTFLKNSLAAIADTGLKKKVLFTLSTLAYDLEEYDTMKSCLDSLLSLDPQHVPALNTYAYYYATKGKDIARAEEYFAKAYEKEPENIWILDTKATILYKKKEYRAAQKILQQLAAKMSDNALIWAHLALVHYKIGNNGDVLTCAQHAQLHAKYPYECQKIKKLHTLLDRQVH
ncbi:MAG TPA: tetratricopeptide repeat protein [Candidatus Bathyarchaeia archaeon]|nr:tetratricopeptide repeat protein [Candidatus Bathyarchaeia archaeon]